MLRPIGDKLIVRRDDLTTPPDVLDRFFKDGRLIMPETAKAKSRMGIVVSVGPGVRENIRRGDRVVITWLDGTKYDDDDLGPVELFLESEILAVVD